MHILKRDLFSKVKKWFFHCDSSDGSLHKKSFIFEMLFTTLVALSLLVSTTLVFTNNIVKNTTLQPFLKESQGLKFKDFRKKTVPSSTTESPIPFEALIDDNLIGS